ncbi:MAG: glycerol-3-phosphate dehydrogenase, partial [Anaerolineae bacterium]|nr:glycerol-3-phosphate dehydrogenase [Anaerolineae bacterium]
TDIHIDDPDQAACTEEEVDYILELVNLVFPGMKVDRSHIVFWFTGVRPLPSSDAATAGQISRDHSIRITEPDGVNFPVFALVGGKWTTFRAFAEQAADKLFERLAKHRRAGTETMPIGGGKDYPRKESDKGRWLDSLAQTTGLSLERVTALFDRYGTRAQEIAAYCAAGEDAPLQQHPGYSRREILFLAEREKIIHLDDLLLRRSLMAMLGQVTGDLLVELAGIIAAPLGWPVEKTRQEIERASGILRMNHGVHLE